MAARSAERRDQLVRAGFELLGAEGAAGTTMRAVCRAAGLSLRYFYESFPDREALLVEVYDQVARGLVDAVTAEPVAAGADETARIHAAFDAAARYFEDDPRRSRIMFRETLADDTLRTHGAAALPDFVRLVATQLSPDRADDLSSAQLSMPISALSGALVSLFLDWLAGRVSATRPEIVAYATHLTTAILSPENETREATTRPTTL